MIYPALRLQTEQMFSDHDSVVSVHVRDYEQAKDPMSREQKIAAVEAYLDCFVSKNVSEVPFAEDVKFEAPRMPTLTGRKTIIGFLASIMPAIKPEFRN